MKKINGQIVSALFAATLFFSGECFAQSKETPGDSHDARLGLGLNLGIPTSNPYSFVIGGDLRLQKDFSSNVSGILSAGYESFSLKDNYPGDNLGVIPVKAGIKVFPLERLYISGELGAGFSTDNRGTAFIYAPGIGVGFNAGLDLSLRYEGMGKSNGFENPDQVALRIAYGFNLSR